MNKKQVTKYFKKTRESFNKKFFEKQSMPSDIKLVGKTEVVTLRGLL